MKTEIRSARPEEMDEYYKALNNAFLPPPPEVPPVKIPPEWTMCAIENGRIATTYGAWLMSIRFNGEALPVAGVTQVSTLPYYRRRGHLRKITERHFIDLHERGERPMAILLAAHAAIYQRFGYGIVSTQNAYEVAPRHIQSPLPRAIPGECRPVDDDEFELLKKLYKAFCANRTGYMHRSQITWDAGVLSPPPKGGLLNKIVYEENGRPLGYVIYGVRPQANTQPGEPWQIAHIRDFVWLSANAYRALWETFTHHDLVGKIRWGRVPSDDPLPHLLQEPRKLNCTSFDGLLGRIIDVERALPTRGYGEEGKLVFEVIDDLCPWNNGGWKLEASATGSAIVRTKAEPDLTLPISTLTLLVFGQISATQAARMGRLDVFKDKTLSTWDKVMKTQYAPFCPDMF